MIIPSSSSICSCHTHLLSHSLPHSRPSPVLLVAPPFFAFPSQSDLDMLCDGHGLQRIESDETVRAEIVALLTTHYQAIVNIFKHYCAPGSGHIFSVTLNPFSEFTRDSNMISDDPQDKLDVGDLDTIYIEAKYQHQQKNKHNIKSTLARFEFIEALCRTAKRKFTSTKDKQKTKTLSEALELLLLHHLPLAKRVRDPTEFRKAVVYYEDVTTMLKRNMRDLTSIFHRFSGAHQPRLGRVLRWADWSDLLYMSLSQSMGEGEDVGYIGGLTEREVRWDKVSRSLLVLYCIVGWRICFRRTQLAHRIDIPSFLHFYHLPPPPCLTQTAEAELHVRQNGFSGRTFGRPGGSVDDGLSGGLRAPRLGHEQRRGAHGQRAGDADGRAVPRRALQLPDVWHGRAVRPVRQGRERERDS